MYKHQERTSNILFGAMQKIMSLIETEIDAKELKTRVQKVANQAYSDINPRD